MAITATFRNQTGTTKTWKSSGGDAAITFASLANGSYRQGAKLDLGATFAAAYAVFLDTEHAATHIAIAAHAAAYANAMRMDVIPEISDFDRWFNANGTGLDRASAKAGWDARGNLSN